MAKTYHIRLRGKPRSEVDFKKLINSYFLEHKKAAKSVRYVNRHYVEIDGVPYDTVLAQTKLPLFWSATLKLVPQPGAAKPAEPAKPAPAAPKE